MTEFFKLSGAGNDFLALVEPDRLPGPEEIRAWCRRGVSVGADGLCVVRRTEETVTLDYFNADGKPAALCINGTRCAARLAFHLGWAQDVVTVVTGAGPLRARQIDPTRVALEIPPLVSRPRAAILEAAGKSWEGWEVKVGVPHFVLIWEGNLALAPVEAVGPRLRNHFRFRPQGTNVDFVHFVDSHRLEIRSYERGVEAETLACGTGVLAATATGLALGRLQLPVAATTRGGFVLEVARGESGPGSDAWSLTGDARILFHGQLLPEASQLPAEPSWGRSD